MRSGVDEVVATRALALVGQQTMRREAEFDRREAELRKEEPRLSRDELFRRRIELHDLRRAAAD